MSLFGKFFLKKLFRCSVGIANKSLYDLHSLWNLTLHLKCEWIGSFMTQKYVSHEQ